MCFVEDFDAVFDSEISCRAGETDLSRTLFFKLLTVCGTFLSFNEGKNKQVCWIEETRSVSLTVEEKQQLLGSFAEPSTVTGDDARTMAIGIHFRMKGLSKGEPKTLKQLRADSEALNREHPGQVCCSEELEEVKTVSDLLFRTFNISEKGHAMAGQ